METVSLKHFDALDFVKKAKEFGINEDFAEYQARQIEQVIDQQIQAIEQQNRLIQEQRAEITTLKSKELATKGDLLQLKYDMLKFIIWTGMGVVFAIGGMLAKGFHWF